MRHQPLSGDSTDDEDDAGFVNNRYATAETPLLGRDSPEEPRSLYRQNVIILIFAFLFIAELGGGLFVAPSSAVMENIICRNYYPEVSDNIMVSDPRCKRDDVQGTLATIRGWAYTFDCLPGILGAVPYGIMSDKWGRKPVFVLAIFGLVLSIGWVLIVCKSEHCHGRSGVGTRELILMLVPVYFSNIFPLWTIWFGSAFQFIGGSSSVMTAMLYTMGADVTPVADR